MELKGTIANNCSDATVRTGTPNCDRQMGKPLALAVTPVNVLYPIEADTFLENLEGYISDESGMRLMPIKGVVGVALNGGDINAPELGTYGGARPIGINAVNIAYTVDGGMCLYKELSKLNGRLCRVFICDDANYLFGTVITKGGTDYFAGYKGTIYVTFTPTDGSTLGTITVTVYYSTEYEQEMQNAMSVYLENGLPDGLIGVILQSAGADTVRVVTACDQTDVTATYIDDWEQTMFLNESGTAATTVTPQGGNLLKIAPTGKYRVASAKVLAAGNITGLDGMDTYVQVTAGA